MLVFRWRPPVEPLTLRWIVPAGTAAFVAQTPALPQLAAVIGTPGPPGPAGEAAPAASLVTDAAMPAGMPLAIDRATGRFVPADALIYPRAVVVGLATADTEAAHVASAIGAGSLALTDWSAATGTVQLLPGHLYFLAEGGGLTPTRPVLAGSSVAIVGEAVSPTTLNLRRSSPILL